MSSSRLPLELPAPLQGRLISSRYRVVELLGQGGMGAVYRVRDEARGVELALKRLERGAVSGADRLRFRREFHTLAQLRHPGVVEAYEYGVDADGPYYTMELLEGQDLYELGQLPPERALRVLRELAETLAFLHSRRLVHRDVAPRNIRFDARGRAKLLDFGILASVGTPGEVAGTPPYMAPESLRGLPLDHRADLFGLGAVAYRLLTGHHAFAAKAFAELEPLWSRPVPVPSSIVSQLPPEVDRLVLSLLSIEALRRPRSAAEVVDRLDAVLGAGASAGARREVAEGFLASTALVGRQRELMLLRRLVEKALVGQGDAVIIEGPLGCGKTRLLRELALEAQLAGMLVLNVRAEPGSRAPYGVMRSLARALFAAAPDDATQAALLHREELARVPELAARLGIPVPPPLADPSEQRLRLHSALVDWLRSAAARRPLCLVLDDVHACDEGSASLLARLCQAAPGGALLLGVGGATDQPVRAPEALAALRRAGQRLRLRGLSEVEVEELLRITFGDGPELKRLARWAYQTGGGNPLHTAELARDLVTRGVVRYDNGLWVVAAELPRDVPRALVDALDARLGELSAPARALAQALSVCEGELPIDLCVRMAGGADEASVFAALDELLAHDVLVGGGASFRFGHAAVRGALQGALSAERKQSLHLAAGRALKAQAGSEELQSEVAWHLLRGGEEREGARLLELAGRKLFDAQSFHDAIEPLEAALHVLERLGGSPATALELRYKLLFCGSVSDCEVAVRYLEPAMVGMFAAAGLPLAQRLRRWVGPLPALLAGVLAASGRWLFTRPSRRPMAPLPALLGFVLGLGSAATTCALLNDMEGLRRWIALAETVLVDRARLPYALLLFLKNLEAFSSGRWREVEANAAIALRIYATDTATRVPELARRLGEACTRMPLALLAASQQQPERFARELATIERLDLRMFDGHLTAARAYFHRVRGEEERAVELDTQAELLFLQLGSVWGAEVQRVLTSGLCYALTRDVLGLKRSIEQVSRLIRGGSRLELLQALLRGEYHRERGEFPESVAALTTALALAVPGLRQGVLVALAETRLAAGEVALALSTAREAIALGESLGRANVLSDFRAAWVRVLAEAASGELASARAGLEALSATPEAQANPLFTGMVHEARARLALLEGDAALYRLSCVALERCWTPTLNPALMARVQRLMDAGAVRGAESVPSEVVSEAVTVVRRPDISAAVVLAECRGAAERAARALELLVWESGGAAGYLYLLRGAELTLAAPTHGEEPPDAVPRALGRFVEAWCEEQPVTLPAVLPMAGDETRWHPTLLLVESHGEVAVVGAVAISEGSLHYREVAPQILKDVSQALWEAGDATTRTRKPVT